MNDSIEQKLFQTNLAIYQSYMTLKSKVQGISLPYYDIRDCGQIKNLPTLSMDWLKRKAGILSVRDSQDASNEITFLVKKRINEKFEKHVESLTYPECELSPFFFYKIYA